MRYAIASQGSRFLAAAFVLLPGVFCAGAQQVRYSAEHRDAERTLPQTVSVAGPATLKAKLAGTRTGISIAVADFDADGTRDLMTGYAAGKGGVLLLQRGSPVATAPTPKEWSVLARGELVTPFVAKAEAIDLPVRPDLIQTADIHGHGHADLAVAAKGDSSLYLLFGRGDGSFAAPQSVPLAGAINSLATWTDAAGNNLVAAGVCGGSGCGVQFLNREGQAEAFVPTADAVTAIQTGSIDGGPRQDLIFVAGGKVLVLDGDTALSASPVLETLPVAHGAGLAVGSFVADRRGYQQIAVLDRSATLHVLTRAGIDSTAGTSAERAAQQQAMRQRAQSGRLTNPAPLVKRTGTPWAEVETLPNIGPGGEDVLFLRAHLNAGGNDDLAAIAGTQYVTVAHTIERDGPVIRTKPIVTIDSTSAPVRAALATRVSADARHGIVTLSAQAQPLTVNVPPTYRTYYVTTPTDGTPTTASLALCVANVSTAGCTLRSAITNAEKDRTSTGIAKVDTINIPAGTYTISSTAYNLNSSGATQTIDYLGSVNNHFEVDASMNLVGAGCTNTGVTTATPTCATIINGNNIDQVFSIDFGSFYATSEGDFESFVQDTFVSGMMIENGKNPNTPAGYMGYTQTTGCSASGGNCNDFGGNIDWVVEGNSNLVFNNVVITGGQAPYQGGGGIYYFYDNTSSGTPGPLEFDNSTISSNRTVTPSFSFGGGIESAFANNASPQPLVLNNVLVTGNSTANGGGGGIDVSSNANGAVTITNSSITNNTAGGSEAIGGGIDTYFAPFTMTGTTVKGNAAGAFGGGMYVNPGPYTQSILTSTFTSNTLTGATSGYTYNIDGAGVCLQGDETTQSPAASFTLHYNRFHGNTGSGAHATGLALGCAFNGTGTVNATDNWWGCNPSTATTASGQGATAVAGTGCDTAAIGNGAGTLVGGPYTTLRLSLSSTTPAFGATIVATGSLGQDAGGTVYSAANDLAYLATPITFFTLTNTGTVTYNPSSTAFSTTAATGTSNAAATASATVNASGTATLTVDGQTLTANYTVAPMASSQSVTVPFNTAQAITLSATNSPTVYTVVTNPAHGSLSGTAPNLTYTPAANYSGSDSFTFTAGNAAGTSNTATVSITVTPGTPTANSQSVSTAFNTAKAITLTASDPDSPALALTYTVVTGPAHGALAGTAPNLTYTPAANYSGSDSFTFAVNNGTNTSNTATVAITVTPGTPTANSQSVSTAFNTAKAITLTASDPDSPALTLTYTVVTGPAHGSLAGTAPNLTYTPAANYSGSDSFTFRVSNGTNTSNTATVTLTVTPGIPTANSQSVNVPFNTATGITLTASDPDSPALTLSYTVVTAPAHGTLSGTAPNLTYTPTANYAGSDSFTFRASNGTNTSNTATVSLTVSTGPAASFAVSGLATFSAPQQSGTVTVTAVDLGGHVVTGFTGTVTLSSTDPLVTFTPASYNYTAADLGVHTFSVTFNTAGTQTVTATSGGITGSETGILVQDAIWILNSAGTLTRTTDTGAQTTTAGTTLTSATYGGLAFDNAGDVWSVISSSNTVREYNRAGVALGVSGSSNAGVNTPAALYIDGLGQVWVANGNSTVSVLNGGGVAVSPNTGYQGGGMSSPSGIIVDSAGAVWVTNRGNNSVTKIFGAAAPVVTPIVTGTTNNTLGTRP